MLLTLLVLTTTAAAGLDVAQTATIAATATVAATPVATELATTPVATAPVATATQAADAEVPLRAFGGLLELMLEGGAPLASSRFDGVDHHGPFAGGGARVGFSTAVLDLALGVMASSNPVPGSVWERQALLAGRGLTAEAGQAARAEFSLCVEVDQLDARTRVHVLAGGVYQIERWRIGEAGGASAELEHHAGGPLLGLGLLYRLAGQRGYIDLLGEVAVRALWYGNTLTATKEDGQRFADEVVEAMSRDPFSLELGVRVGLRFGLLAFGSGKSRAVGSPSVTSRPEPVRPSDGRTIPIR